MKWARHDGYQSLSLGHRSGADIVWILSNIEGRSVTTQAATPAVSLPKLIGFGVPLLGIIGAVQGSSPNINSTALVSLSRDLSMSSGVVAIAASMQTLAAAATVITTGLLADRLGRKRVLMAALALSVIGATVCGLAPVSAVYLLGQCLTGIGLGAAYGAAFAYVRAVAKPGKLASALGVFGAVIGLTTLILTFLGGSLVGVNWRLAFFVVAAGALLCLLLVPITLPKQPRITGSSFDLIGQILLAIGIIGFLYGISHLGRSLTDPLTTVPLLGGAIILVAFFVYESKNKSAFYPVRIFKSPIFIAAILAGFVYNFGTAVAFLQSTNLWQYVTNVPTKDIAFWQVPLVGAGVIGALVAGKLLGRGMANKTAILGSTVVVVIGFVGLAIVHGSTSFWVFAIFSALAGAGLLATSVPFGNLIIEEAPPAQYGPVTSSRTTIGQFFYSIGFALATIMVDRLTIGGVTEKLTASGVQPDLIGTAVTSVDMYASSGTEPSTTLGKQALADAVVSYGNSYSSVMITCAALILIAGVVAWVLLTKSREGKKPQTAAAQ